MLYIIILQDLSVLLPAFMSKLLKSLIDTIWSINYIYIRITIPAPELITVPNAILFLRWQLLRQCYNIPTEAITEALRSGLRAPLRRT